MSVDIPVVDLQAALADDAPEELLAAVRAAAEQIGIIQVVNHGVPQEVIDEFHTTVGRVLALPRAEKERSASPTGHPSRGWRQWPDDFGRLELERINIGQYDNPEDALAAGLTAEQAQLFAHVNVWPEQEPALRAAAFRYRDAVAAVGRRVLALYARVLGVPDDTFPVDEDGYSTFVVNDYPTWTHTDTAADDEKLLLLEHADGSVVTVLHQEGDYAGLQGQRPDGSWQSVPILPGALQVFTGSLLTNWTEGRLRPGLRPGGLRRHGDPPVLRGLPLPHPGQRGRAAAAVRRPRRLGLRAGLDLGAGIRQRRGVPPGLRPPGAGRRLARGPPVHRGAGPVSARTGAVDPAAETVEDAAVGVELRAPLPENVLTWEPSERRVRGVKGGTTVVDSRRPILVWEPGKPVPLYAFPREDVRTELLRPAADPELGAHSGSQLFYDLVLDGETSAGAAWTFPGEELAPYIAFEWFRAQGRGLDHWYEEEEEIFIHPRDPYKRIDALTGSRHVRVEIDGVLVAESRMARTALRDAAADALLPSARGRTVRSVHADGSAHRLPVQGHGRVLVPDRRGRGQRDAAQHRLELPRAAARRRGHLRSRRLLQRGR